MEEEYNQLLDAIEALENKAESSNDAGSLHEEFYEVEEQFQQFEAEVYDEYDLDLIRSKLNALRKELDVYDEAGERDSMYPDGDEEDVE